MGVADDGREVVPLPGEPPSSLPRPRPKPPMSDWLPSSSFGLRRPLVDSAPLDMATAAAIDVEGGGVWVRFATLRSRMRAGGTAGLGNQRGGTTLQKPQREYPVSR